MLNHFNLQEGTDYQWSDLQYRDSAKTQDMYPSLNDFEMAIGNCSTGQPDYHACLCEHSRYWAERYGEENDLDINCDSYDLSYWYHPDYLGNTEFVTDADGSPFQYFWYSAWGEAIESQHSNQGSFSSRYRFNAKEWDAETGNYYYGARYYDPKKSIWLSVDPLAHKFLHITPYAYVENNPLNLVDPTGMAPETYEIDKQGNTTKIDNTKYYREGDGTITTVAEGGSYEGNGTEVDRVQSQSDPAKGIYTSKSTMNSKRTLSREATVTTPSGREKQENFDVDIYTIDNSGEAKEFFEFAADVSDVEWGNTKIDLGYGTQNKVTTSHKRGMSIGLGLLDQSGYSILQSDHSHPGHSRIHGGDAAAIRGLQLGNQDAIFRVYYPGRGYRGFNQSTGR